MDDRLLAGRYRLLEPLGHGGMGQVHRGWDELLGRPVAVKTMELDGADPTSAARFRREAVTTGWLSHPNIVTVFDTGTDAGTGFIVMELLAGPSLQTRLVQAGPLPVAEAVRAGMQVADALQAAHAAGVVHRDVKPHNVCYCDDGRVKVLDFGIAQLAGQSRLTRTAMVMGTADYLAPEQATGERVGAYSDLYALGCVLFAVLTGAPPFAGGTQTEVLARHLHARPPALADVWPGCPAQLSALVGELLAKDPARRPRDAAVVRDRLAAIAGLAEGVPAPPVRDVREQRTGTRSLTSPPVPRGRSRSLTRRQAAVASVGSAALVAVTAAVALSGSTGRGAAASGQTGSATVSRTPSPSPSPSPSSPSQAISAFSEAVTRAEAQGGIAPPAAQNLLHRMTDLRAAVQSGTTASAGTKVADLVRHVGDLERTGQITAEGQRLLTSALAALERAIPPQTAGPGAGGPAAGGPAAAGPGKAAGPG